MRSLPFAVLGLVGFSGAAACGGHSSSSSALPAADSNGAPAAPATVSCASFASPTADAASRSSLYHDLTASRWSYPYCNGNGSGCNGLELHADGTYTFSESGYSTSGSSPNADTGSWNFAVIDSSSGVVCLDGANAGPTHEGGASNLPSALHFTFGGSSYAPLQMGGYVFSAVQDLPAVDGASPDLLPNVRVSAGFAALVGQSWTKTNAFDQATTADTIVFDPSGKFVASYRGGACSFGGFLSWDRDSVFAASDSSQCNVGNYQTTLVNQGVVPGFFDDILVLGQSTYRHTGAVAGKPNEFVFDPYGHSVRVYGTYEGALKAGAAATLSLTFENTDAVLSRTLGTFAATLQSAVVSQGQTVSNGPVVQLGSLDFGNATIGPGEKHYASLAITPTAAGDSFALAMRLTFQDSTRTYDGSHTFLTAVAP